MPKRSHHFYFSDRHIRRKARKQLEDLKTSIDSKSVSNEQSEYEYSSSDETDIDRSQITRFNRIHTNHNISDIIKNDLNENYFAQNNDSEITRTIDEKEDNINQERYLNENLLPRNDNTNLFNESSSIFGTVLDLNDGDIDDEDCYYSADDGDNDSDTEDFFYGEASSDNTSPTQSNRSSEIFNGIELPTEFYDSWDNTSDFLKYSLAFWAAKFQISQRAIALLLFILRRAFPDLELPKDPRTLLRTPAVTEIHNISGGQYWHFGFNHCLEKIAKGLEIIKPTVKRIQLLINIDGAPIGKSTDKSLWLILCSEKYVKEVRIIGVFYGASKPSDSNKFLTRFVSEAKVYTEKGYEYNGTKYDVDIHGIICDSPAKSFILNTKYHSGYHSCSKCDVTGDYDSTVFFPVEKGIERTDESFKNEKYLGTYKKETTILNEIPKLGLVSNVPLDPMHLIYIGVVKKLLLLWLISKFKDRLPLIKQNKISPRLLVLKNYVTSDFNRKPRPLKYIKFYKATELRLFLLCTGFIALKGIVSERVYSNFLALHVAITILSNERLLNNIKLFNFADKLLQRFVINFSKIYGKKYVSHNIHGLLHLDDVKKYGTLEKFSAFIFENFIGMFKRLLRKGEQPLQQLMRRSAEMEIVGERMKYKKKIDNVQTRREHSRLILTDQFKNFEVKEFGVLFMNNYTLNCEDDKNSFVLIDEKITLRISNIVECNNNFFAIGLRMKDMGDFYTQPCKSLILGIRMVVEDGKSELEAWPISRITAKLMRFPFNGQFVVCPILHSYECDNDE